MYLPEPPFAHGNLLKSGKLKYFKNISDGKFAQGYQEPCVIFAGHPSLRCGDMVSLIEGWKSNPRNGIVFVGLYYLVIILYNLNYYQSYIKLKLLY